MLTTRIIRSILKSTTVGGQELVNLNKSINHTCSRNTCSTSSFMAFLQRWVTRFSDWALLNLDQCRWCRPSVLYTITLVTEQISCYLSRVYKALVLHVHIVEIFWSWIPRWISHFYLIIWPCLDRHVLKRVRSLVGCYTEVSTSTLICLLVWFMPFFRSFFLVFFQRCV